MAPQKLLNQYRFEEDCVVGICSSGVEFLIDYMDYDKIKQYTWRNQKSGIYTNLTRGNPISLPRFILGCNKKVFHKNKNNCDCRRKNLFYGNEFLKHDGYYDVKCYDGRTFKIDFDDYDKVSKYTWHIDKGGYVITKGDDGKIYKLHRYIMDVCNCSYPEIDHKNRDKLDNRKQNLRFCNRSENCINTIDGRNTSGVVGVYWNKSAQKWCAQLTKGMVKYYLGSYDSFDEAVSARKNAELKYHKQFSPFI